MVWFWRLLGWTFAITGLALLTMTFFGQKNKRGLEKFKSTLSLLIAIGICIRISAFCFTAAGSDEKAAEMETLTSFPKSDETYDEMTAEIGCESNYTDRKKREIFDQKYRGHTVTWDGTIAGSRAHNIYVGVHGAAAFDVDFDDPSAGSNLTIGAPIRVKFVLETLADCNQIYTGDHGVIVVASPEERQAEEEKVARRQAELQRAAEQAAEANQRIADEAGALKMGVTYKEYIDAKADVSLAHSACQSQARDSFPPGDASFAQTDNYTWTVDHMRVIHIQGFDLRVKHGYEDSTYTKLYLCDFEMDTGTAFNPEAR